MELKRKRKRADINSIHSDRQSKDILGQSNKLQRHHQKLSSEKNQYLYD